MTSTRAVYSALIGGYERLQEQPIARTSSVPFICFTDDPELESDTWELRVIDPILPADAVRSARTLKIVGHPSLAGVGESLWIDNRVTLTADPVSIIDEWLADADVALFEHSFRATLADEFDAVVAGGYDDPERVAEQLRHYTATVPTALGAKPMWTGIIARRRTPAVDELMVTWWAHVLRYSRRDQLSASVVFDGADRVDIRPSTSNHESDVHLWPPIGPALGRRVASG